MFSWNFVDLYSSLSELSVIFCLMFSISTTKTCLIFCIMSFFKIWFGVWITIMVVSHTLVVFLQKLGQRSVFLWLPQTQHIKIFEWNYHYGNSYTKQNFENWHNAKNQNQVENIRQKITDSLDKDEYKSTKFQLNTIQGCQKNFYKDQTFSPRISWI